MFVGAGRQKNPQSLSQMTSARICSVSCERQIGLLGEPGRFDKLLKHMINPIWHAPC